MVIKFILKLKTTMNGLYLLLLGLLVYVVLAIIIIYYGGRDVITGILLGWLVFNTLICIYEITMVVNRRQMYISCQNEQGVIIDRPSFWKEEYEIEDFFRTEFWMDGWSEYGRFDPRYLNPNSYVHLIESINVVDSLIPSILVIVLILAGYDWRVGWVRTLLIIVSIFQIVFTVIYLLTSFDVGNSQYWFYFFFNIPWIIFPVLILVALYNN